MYFFFILIFFLSMKAAELTTRTLVPVYNNSKESIIIYTHWREEIWMITDAQILYSQQMKYFKPTNTNTKTPTYSYIQKGNDILDIKKLINKFIIRIEDFFVETLIVEDDPSHLSGLNVKIATKKEIEELKKKQNITEPPIEEFLNIDAFDEKLIKEKE